MAPVMPRPKYDLFAIWLGVTVFGAAVLFFLIVTRFSPDFFSNLTFVL